jgi:hypothetical protein
MENFASAVLPRGRNFGPNHKWGQKNGGAGKSGRKFMPYLYIKKKAEKRPNFFEVNFFIKASRFPAKNYSFQLIYLIFLYHSGS